MSEYSIVSNATGAIVGSFDGDQPEPTNRLTIEGLSNHGEAPLTLAVTPNGVYVLDTGTNKGQFITSTVLRVIANQTRETKVIYHNISGVDHEYTGDLTVTHDDYTATDGAAGLRYR